MVFKALLGKIKQGLARTRDVFGGVAALFRLRGRVDQKFLDELEKRLYLAAYAGRYGYQPLRLRLHPAGCRLCRNIAGRPTGSLLSRAR